MKVYLVIDDNWQAGASVQSIHSTRELAEVAAEPDRKHDRERGREWGEIVVEEWEVDEVVS
jgi:hypothetical protein